MKLTKAQMKQHEMACKLLEKDSLTFDEKWDVYENWHEGAEHNNGSAGAFFTPPYLARDFAIDVCGPKVVDLCAGTGVLSFMYYHCGAFYNERKPEITCVEINPAYVAIGKKLLPEATWICADISEIWQNLGKFDTAIGNPPFGKQNIITGAPRYTGAEAEYKIIDIASRLASYGTFIIPQQSASFRYSGAQYYQRHNAGKFAKFFAQTGIDIEAGCGVDTTYHQNDWHGVSPLCEIVTCDFGECRKQRPGLAEQLTLL
jgi:predicted RNA methylase